MSEAQDSADRMREAIQKTGFPPSLMQWAALQAELLELKAALSERTQEYIKAASDVTRSLAEIADWRSGVAALRQQLDDADAERDAAVALLKDAVVWWSGNGTEYWPDWIARAKAAIKKQES